jgi:hypothetical protein
MEREQFISEIKSIIDKWGGVTTCEMELDASPVYNSFGKDHIQLVERFNRNSVTIVTYIHETEVDEFDVDYDQLSEELLYDIYDTLTQYDIGMEKTMDKIRNENY